VKHFHVRVAKLDLVAVMKSGERMDHIGSLMDAVLRPDPMRQLRPAGPMVGVDVRVDDVRQAKTLGIREFDVTNMSPSTGCADLNWEAGSPPFRESFA
jgi:hypothetical protein